MLGVCLAGYCPESSASSFYLRRHDVIGYGADSVNDLVTAMRVDLKDYGILGQRLQINVTALLPTKVVSTRK